jgi:hypothetical protein
MICLYLRFLSLDPLIVSAPPRRMLARTPCWETLELEKRPLKKDMVYSLLKTT